MATFRLAASAKADILSILAWTDEHFGDLARRRYEALLVAAFRDIAENPGRPGTIGRPELGPSVRSYHLRHSRAKARLLGGVVRKPRHLLLYRLEGEGIVDIGRVLHDAMELERHMPPTAEED
ncbi:MAG: type II toxin-antitoxin system RelE/ParE family toxin [Alphaproteobacteria bacterium]|nr:type II toxin-antitoxin system RelE/ParE family toxin [Alphaproteobacteria bacterium]